MTDLSTVQWGEFKIGDLFESSNGDTDIQKKHIDNLGNYVITAGATNDGIMGKSSVKAKVFSANTITIDMFGLAYFRPFEYKMATHARVFSLKAKKTVTPEILLFFVTSLSYLSEQYCYDHMCSWNKIKDKKISLPIDPQGAPDYGFMEAYIKEIEQEKIVAQANYLQATGLSDAVLTTAEQQAIADFDSLQWGEFKIGDLFDTFTQGKRLTRAEQKAGDLPYIMAGVTDRGIANYVSNAREIYPENSITIDTLGNVFYRDHAYGAGDDTGMIWSSTKKYNKQVMIFISNCIQHHIKGKYSYSYRIRSSNFGKLIIHLPIDPQGTPDYQYMETYIKAIEKLTVKDVIAVKDRQIALTKQV